jgi:formate dehydrogenase subunit delta
MRHDDLVRRINQIAQFFDAYPASEATAGVREHVQKFWDPAMRAQIIASRQSLAERLHPLARAALDQLADDAAA